MDFLIKKPMTKLTNTNTNWDRANPFEMEKMLAINFGSHTKINIGAVRKIYHAVIDDFSTPSPSHAVLGSILLCFSRLGQPLIGVIYFPNGPIEIKPTTDKQYIDRSI